MPDPVSHAEPIACSLGRDNLAERQRRWYALADNAILNVSPTQHGVRMRFLARADVEAELRDLASLELDCCSFADWTVHSEGDTLAMDVRGINPAAVAAVRTMFVQLRAPSRRRATTSALLGGAEVEPEDTQSEVRKSINPGK